MKYTKIFYRNVIDLVNSIEEFEDEKIRLAAFKVADTTENNGIIHSFGSGHSVLASLETFIRAGSFSNTKPINKELEIDRFERLSGIGKALMKKFSGLPGEVMFIFSNSGRNPLPIEITEEARKKGLFTIAITSFRSAEIDNSDSTNLINVVDLPIDSHVPYGDASVQLDDTNIKMAPLSSIANAILLHAIYCKAAEILISRGITPPIRISRNTPTGDAYNKKFIEMYASRIPELRY